MGVYTDLEEEFDIEIVDEFLSHYIIMTDALENLIIGLKHEENFKGNIDQIFRIMHNLKSSSGYLKIHSLNQVVSLAEEVLEDCRSLQGKASEDLIDWLLIISDQLQAYKNNLNNNTHKFEIINYKIIQIPEKLIEESTSA